MKTDKLIGYIVIGELMAMVLASSIFPFLALTNLGILGALSMIDDKKIKEKSQ